MKERSSIWQGIPEHNPILELDIYRRITANPADEQARNELAINNIRYAVVVAKNYFPWLKRKFMMTENEIYSEVVKATLHAAKSPTYMPQKGPFKNYLATCVNNQLKTVGRNNLKYHPSNQISLDEKLDQDRSFSDLIADEKSPDSYRNTQIKDLYSCILKIINDENILTPKEKQAVQKHFLDQGTTYRQTGLDMNVKKQRVWQLLYTAKKKIRDRLRELEGNL